jgi:uncharacterized membrane protein
VQPVTGYLLARFLGYPIFDGWIALSLILYAVTGALDPGLIHADRHAKFGGSGGAWRDGIAARVSPLFWTWFAFGFPAFAAVLGILWLMTSRPMFSFR